MVLKWFKQQLLLRKWVKDIRLAYKDQSPQWLELDWCRKFWKTNSSEVYEVVLNRTHNRIARVSSYFVDDIWETAREQNLLWRVGIDLHFEERSQNQTKFVFAFPTALDAMIFKLKCGHLS